MSSLVEGGKKRKKEKKKQPKRKRLKEAVDEDEDNEVRILNPLQNVLNFKQFAFPDGHCFFHTMYKCIRHIRPNFEFKMASPKQQERNGRNGCSNKTKTEGANKIFKHKR